MVVGLVIASEHVRQEEEQADALEEGAMSGRAPEVEQSRDQVYATRLHMQLAERVPFKLDASRAEHQAAIAEYARMLADVTKRHALGIEKFYLCLRRVVPGHREYKSSQ